MDIFLHLRRPRAETEGLIWVTTPSYHAVSNLSPIIMSLFI